MEWTDIGISRAESELNLNSNNNGYSEVIRTLIKQMTEELINKTVDMDIPEFMYITIRLTDEPIEHK